MSDVMMVIQLGAIVVGMAVQTWLIIRYLIDRMDQKMKEEREERLREQSKTDSTINDFRDTHVRRDDFHRHVDNVEKQIGNLVIMISNLGTKFDTRLDAMMSIMAQYKAGDNKNAGEK